MNWTYWDYINNPAWFNELIKDNLIKEQSEMERDANRRRISDPSTIRSHG
jgi:hypothetical protein